MIDVIQVKNLCSDHHHNLDFNLKKNEIHGIIGPSGGGKSYFLKILLNLAAYNSGEILNAQGEKWNYSEESISMHFQSNGLLNNLTIGENIMMPLIVKLNMDKVYAKSLAISYMEKVGLDIDDFVLYPVECSGGMQKRAALARALILNPQILFLDEPTAGIDCILLEVFDNIIKSLKNVSIVMVTHDLARLCRIADSVSILVDKKFHTGTIKSLMNSENLEVRNFMESYARVSTIF